MKKFILVGGYASRAADRGQAFAEEVVEGFDQPIRILECLFARPRDAWQEGFESDKVFFGMKLRDRKIVMTLADPAIFVEQLKHTDVVYFRGGRTKQLIEALKECEGWEKELEGKTIAGSSAGANFLARYYYSLDNLEVCEGLGILPIKILVHYKSDYNAPHVQWNNAYDELKNAEDDLPILTIPEGGFEIL